MGKIPGFMVIPQIRTEILEGSEDYVVLVWRRLMLLAWRGTANAKGIERSRVLFEQWLQTQPRGGAFLIVVPDERTPPPDAETRAAMQRTASSPLGPFKGMATLIEAEGFIAASVRSIMMRLQPREAGAPAVFGKPADAAAWAAGLLEDPEITTAGLMEALRTARMYWAK
ncbi:MAG: hypothetical protein QM784_21590 [Polyangiaceae bacterium]